MKLPQQLNLSQTTNTWASAIEPVLNNPLTTGIQLKDISLTPGNNSINHLLQRKLIGYVITGMRDTFAQVLQVTSQTPNLTLALNSSGPTTVDIYVY